MLPTPSFVVKIRHNGREIAVVDCVHWSPGDTTEICHAGHNVSKCQTCEHRAIRSVFSRPETPQDAETRHAINKGVRGLGDVVAAMTKAVGIAPCGGCKERQEQLNRLIPFGKQEDNGTSSTLTA